MFIFPVRTEVAYPISGRQPLLSARARKNVNKLKVADFTLPRFNTVTHGKHSVRFLGPKLWSKLPKNNRDAESLNVFKKRIRDLNLSELIDDGCRGCGLCSS